MRNAFLFLPILLSTGIFTCCNSVPDITIEDEPEFITLSLGVAGAGETKGESTSNIYGINIKYDSKKDGSINSYYAYGLFDNTDDMTVQLLKGYHYSFICTMVKDGKNVLYCGQYGNNTFNGYAMPFLSVSGSTALGNRFIYKNEDDDYLTGLGTGTATLKTTSGYDELSYPQIQRYYGEYSNYTPNSGDIVVIPLKKTVFGLRLIIEKVPEGKLQASCSDLLSGNSTSDSTYDSGTHIFSFNDVRGCWASDNYSLSLSTTWSFTSSVFNQWNQSGQRALTLKRNVLSTVTVSYSPDNASGSVGIIEEELNENNIYMFVNSDGVIEIGIRPEPED